MANSKTFLIAEDWIRRQWMSQQFGQRFSRERLQLRPGGLFDFDAVSADHRIAAVISASGGRTRSGKDAGPKLQKIRSDILFLMMADVDRRLVVFADSDMFRLAAAERDACRLPTEIELLLADLPDELKRTLITAREDAANEER